MNNNVNKYFALMALLLGSFVSLILFLVLFFYLLKLFSITFFNIPGTENVFHVVIILVPYIVYYASYYYLQKKIAKASTKASKSFGWFFLITGIIICTTTLVMAFMVFFKINNPWIRVFDANSHYAFIAQIVFLFATSMAIASGDEKEKDWMERGGR
jgi:hypothetical protein